MKFVHADPDATVAGSDALPGKVNYFVGKDAKKWRSNVPTYAQVRYRNIYPGVDLAYHGSQGGHLEYDFIVAPGADPAAIALNITSESEVRSPKSEVPSQTENSRVREEARHSRETVLSRCRLRIDASGNLVILADSGQVVFHKPVVYQGGSGVRDGFRNSKLEAPRTGNHQSPITNRQFIEAHYILTASNQVRFALGPYDHSRPLVIDPVLNYATYLGGSSANLGSGIAVDASGDAYVVGSTFSVDFPTMNPEQPNHANDNGLRDAFVAELNPTGTALVYSTYLGGSGDDEGYGVALDTLDNAYVVGTTSSSDFPTTGGVYQSSLGGTTNVFITKLIASGSALAYSTYLGGNNNDYGRGVAVDSAQNVYVTGYTSSSNFPTANAYQSTLNGNTNAFVAKLNTGATALVYSTYVGGNYVDYGQGIAIDSSGDAYITGYTSSYNFPTLNAYQSSLPGTTNPFVTKLNPAGNGLVYSTYVGSYEFDYGYGIAVNSAGNAFITGATGSYYFPIAGNAYQYYYAGGLADAFVAELTPSGNNLVYSTYLGGSGQDIGYAIALDSAGDAFVTGSTTSPDFPTSNAFQSSHGNDYGESDAFVAMLNGAGSSLTYSSFLGGNNYDYGYGIALDSSGNAYVVGQTSSSDFPTSPNAFQNADSAETQEAFVAQVQGVALSASISLSPNPLPFGNQPVGITSPTQSITLSNPGTGPLTITNIVITGDYAPVSTSTSCPYTGGTVVSGGTCTIDVAFTPTATGTRNGTVTVTDNGPGSPQTVSLTGTGTPAVPIAGVSPSSLTFANQAVNTVSASQPVTLSNTGSAPLAIASITATANFGVSSTCGGSVAAGGSCTINVTFAPTTGGALNGTLTVTDNSNGTAGSTQTVSLSGTSLAPLAGVAPSSLTFANQLQGTTSAPQPVTLSNTGTATLTIASITASSNFGQTTTCGGTLAASASCTINVTFTPTATGALSGTLTVTDDSNGTVGSTQTVALSGTGTAPLAGVSPPSLTFASQAVGTTSTSQIVTLTNTGTDVLTITGIAASTNFGQTNTCGGSLAASSSCNINVTFSPTTNGALSGTLTVTDNSGGVAASTQSVTLSGTGGGVPLASLTPTTTLSLGSSVLNATSASQPATLSNVGAAPLAISGIAVTSGYAETSNCPASLAAGTSCTITITFTPTAPGPLSGVLTATDNNNGVAGSTQTLNLSGTGIDFSVGATPNSQAISAGAQAAYTVNVGSLGGTFSNPVTLACSGLPSGTTCAFATSPVTPGANGASTQLTLSTTAPATARLLPPFTGRPPTGLPALLLAVCLAALAAFWRTFRRSPRWAAAGGLLFFVMLATTFMAGCGAGGFPLPKVGGTPAGTYSITVTGTAGSLQHSTIVTLTVIAS